MSKVAGTGEVLATLRREGYDCTPAYLTFLIREGHIIPPGKLMGRYAWLPLNVHAIKAELIRRGRGPEADEG